MNIGEKFYSGLKYSFGSVFLGSVLYTKFVSSDPYTQVYQKSLRIFKPEYVHKVNKFFLQLGLIKKIEREKYEQYLNGKLNGIYLPNIIGLASGYETHGNCAENLFDLGFGYLEIGSLNPQTSVEEDFKNENKIHPNENYVSYNNDEQNLSVLKAKAYLGTFRKNKEDYYKYPIGTNVTPNKETKAFTPYLAEADMVQAAQEILTVSDYVVLNFQGPESQGLSHLLNEEKLKDIVQDIKKERTKQIGLQSIFEFEEYESKTKYEGKYLYNKIYTHELFGKGPINSQVSIPQIYIKLSDVQQVEQIEMVAKKYKELGIEGMVIVNENKQNPTKILRKIYSHTEGKIPIISVGGIDSPQKIIDRVKNGASAVQICSSLYLNGPKYVDDLLGDLVQQLKAQNIDNIRQLKNIDIQ